MLRTQKPAGQRYPAWDVAGGWTGERCGQALGLPTCRRIEVGGPPVLQMPADLDVMRLYVA